eukprot:14546696-Heterocapsa_arctica.AAC.1
MAMGFSCISLDGNFESYAYCMKQAYPDKHTNDNDGVRAKRYRTHEPNIDKGDSSCRRTNYLLVVEHDKHYSR